MYQVLMRQDKVRNVVCEVCVWLLGLEMRAVCPAPGCIPLWGRQGNTGVYMQTKVLREEAITVFLFKKPWKENC